MGNANSHLRDNKIKEPKNDPKQQVKAAGNSNTSGGTPQNAVIEPKGMIRSPSGADIGDKSPMQFQPVDKLSKILLKKTEEEYGLQGISGDIFAKYVFPRFQDLGKHLFNYLKFNSKAKTEYLGVTAFRQQCEKFLGILDDSIILESYVKMYADLNETELIKQENMKELLKTCYNLSMAHYSEGPQTCRMLERTLDSVVSSCFFSKESLSSGYIARWLESNCPRLLPPIHKYCVHALTTSYRTLLDANMKSSTQTVKKINSVHQIETTFGLELQTPILEKANPFPQEHIDYSGQITSEEKRKLSLMQPLLPLSEAWLLAGALPALYTTPQSIKSPPNNGPNLASSIFMNKLLSLMPSHWALLYDSRRDGSGCNRFMHHVLGYRGANLILFRCEENLLFCIASPNEWRETHLYVGGEESCCIQMLPKFVKLENKPKMLYLNTNIRGYPKGLRAGSDPRKPIIIVDEHFDKLEFKGIKYQILSIEVWGCGDHVAREAQLDIKKWEIKEAERNRTVKLSAADWMENPDRYLLELGGRTQYNNSSS